MFSFDKEDNLGEIDDENNKVVDQKKKNKKKNETIKQINEDEDKEDDKEEDKDDDEDVENEENEEDDDDDDEDDEDDDDDDDDDMVADGLTDVGLYNILGNFLTDDEGNSVGNSLSLIAKELSKLNHNLKKYCSKS